MFISEKFVFLELHKTGCTHIRNVLAELVNGELVGKHNQASQDLFTRERVFLGSVRDPWEWYVSLWAFGCDNKGLLFRNVTREYKSFRGLGWRRNPYAAFLKFIHYTEPGKWMDTYRDVNDANAFRAWLRMMHDPNHIDGIGIDYSDCSVSRFVGLMTFRYLKLFCTKLEAQNKLERLSTFEQIKYYENKNCFIDYFIRNEGLEADLLFALEKFGTLISSDIKSKVMSQAKTNTSSREHGPGYYYDIESANLVAQRDRLIIEKFKYVSPILRT